MVPARKAGLAGGVLRMEVGGGEEELLIVGREFCGHARGGGSILRAQAGIDDQRGAAADDDGDVGEAHDRPDVVGNLGWVLRDHRLAHLCEGAGGRQRGQCQKCRKWFHSALILTKIHTSRRVAHSSPILA